MDNMARVLAIVARLRDPARGCPWDLAQTFTSIAPHTLEEAFEVVDAIERGELDDLKEELGDLLLQVVYHAQIAREQGLFDFDQVAGAIADKLVRRHPHIFGDAQFTDDKARSKAWEAAKARERATKAAENDRPRALDGIALALPALTRAQKLQKRAAGKGFDWPDCSGVLEKIEEELAEVRQALVDKESKTRVEEELGDLLFAVVNLARWEHIDPEAALRAGNRKFEGRFKAMESRLADQSRRFEECGPEELDALWEAAKREA